MLTHFTTARSQRDTSQLPCPQCEWVSASSPSYRGRPRTQFWLSLASGFPSIADRSGKRSTLIRKLATCRDDAITLTSASARVCCCLSSKDQRMAAERSHRHRVRRGRFSRRRIRRGICAIANFQSGSRQRHPDRGHSQLGRDDPQLRSSTPIFTTSGLSRMRCRRLPVVNTVSLYVEHGQENIHSVHSSPPNV